MEVWGWSVIRTVEEALWWGKSKRWMERLRWILAWPVHVVALGCLGLAAVLIVVAGMVAEWKGWRAVVRGLA